MQKGLSIVFLSIGLFSIFACSQAPKEQQETDQIEALYDEVMFIHDEVMPKMANIAALQDEIKSAMNQLNEADPVYETYKAALFALNEAETAMWDWMHSFSDEYGQKRSDPEKMEYLEDEKIKISRVSEKMLNSIANAQNVLQNEIN